MENEIIEANYPISFRKKDAMILGEHLKNRRSVVMIGIKRVGISNFLRFFLNHKDIAKTYIDKNSNHLFVRVDLNDLVEKEVFPFWTLTLKRIYDAVENSSLGKSSKEYVEKLFLDSVQSKDIFLTIESIRKSLIRITQENVFPTIFFIRFDRIKDKVTSELFGNLQGLMDALREKLAYVFTSFRSLDFLAPAVFSKSSLSVFSQNMYIKPAKPEDVKIIFDTYKDKYKLSRSFTLKDSLFEIVDGYIQYLQLALIVLHEVKTISKNRNSMFDLLSKDERIVLQSEELWDSLTANEKNVLLKVKRGESVGNEEQKEASYLWDTGFIEGNRIFSPLFSFYIEQRNVVGEGRGVELSKKENLLFNFLNQKVGEICEREDIIRFVWPEEEELGVTDWAIDRLVARLRVKLKFQKNKYEIQTIKTRGYKMVEI